MCSTQAVDRHRRGSRPGAMAAPRSSRVCGGLRLAVEETTPQTRPTPAARAVNKPLARAAASLLARARPLAKTTDARRRPLRLAVRLRRRTAKLGRAHANPQRPRLLDVAPARGARLGDPARAQVGDGPLADRGGDVARVLEEAAGARLLGQPRDRRADPAAAPLRRRRVRRRALRRRPAAGVRQVGLAPRQGPPRAVGAEPAVLDRAGRAAAGGVRTRSRCISRRSTASTARARRCAGARSWRTSASATASPPSWR